MAAAMIKDRGLRKKLTQEAIPEKTPKKPSKRKLTPSSSKNDKKNEQNNNKRPKIQTGDPKLDLFSTYQPWVIQTYGDLAKTKTITLKKYARILRTLRGEECNSSDSSKFRFWVKAKGFHVGKPPGYDAKPADSIVCRYSVADAEGCTRGPEGQEVYSGSQNDPPLYIPTPPLKNAPNQEPVYRKVAVVENFFDIIYTVHVELEGRPGKHAGQKRTYRTITETYAFLPREAVTRFLTGCAECARRPRSASPPPLPTPSPSPTRHPTYLPFLPHCPPDYARNWESEIDATQNYFEPKYDYTDLQPLKKVDSPKPTDVDDQEPTYIELTSKKINGFNAASLFDRSSVEPFREAEPLQTDPEIDKDDSLIDVEDVKSDSPPPLQTEECKKEESRSDSTRAADNEGDRAEVKKKITETYAFLPREAVTRFLTGCAECARRPRSASPPPLPTPSPSPTRHPTYLPFLPHCPPDYARNWESEIDATQNYFEPKYDYTDLQPLKKVDSPKPTDVDDQEPTYIELTSKKINGFNAASLFDRSSVEPFREAEPLQTDPEIDKDDSLIDVEDVKSDSPPPLQTEECKKEESRSDSTRAADNEGDRAEVKKKYNPLDVANLTSKDPPKPRSPPRKKLLPSSSESSSTFGRFPKPWRPDGGLYYSDDIDYSVPITTAYLKHMKNMAIQERLDGENKVSLN
ncbi:uncharacterized protein LOC119837201 [Zerene cesonia]|uniref:uncharacterized protein LOC119837201 n=1 Tax=Zerene cesonia TaxID=33412 RepID=UPI0018E52041|nr:uncharacterized protein LOC119837201 [Zerene cesonia]